MTPDGGIGSVRTPSAAAGSAPYPAWEASAGAAQPLSSYSRFAQRLRRRYAPELPLLPAGTPTPSTMAQAYASLRARGDDTGTGLRILRQLVLERLIGLDCDEQAPLSLVTGVMTELAEFALDVACA